VRRWQAELCELEYLALCEASKGGAGKTARYRLLPVPAPRPRSLGLLTPEELRQRL
jgi:hypothetical protein